MELVLCLFLLDAAELILELHLNLLLLVGRLLDVILHLDTVYTAVI